MRLVEVVRGAATSPETLATAIAVSRRLGKIPAVVGVCHGFVGNRMLRIRLVEAERLLLEGALPQDVDGAFTISISMGPFAIADLSAHDVSWRMRKAQVAHRSDRRPALRTRLLRTENGARLLSLRAGLAHAEARSDVDRLIVDTAARLGIARSAIGKDEILERLLFPMINEGARILAEGIARRPGDIDVIWVYGYGFPAYRGGPMHYADSVGLPRIRDRLIAFAQKTGDDRHRPAPLLEKLAAEGKGFAELNA